MEQVEVKYAPGMRIIVRGEEWMVKKVETNSLGNQTLHVIGLSQLVKDYESMFLVDIEDDIEIVDPAKVTLVPDNSAFFRKSKVYIESQWRGKIPTDNKIHIGNKAAMDLMSYQLEPAQMALNKTRQRILIADTVGLGKTLEAGILMSELIARGKGKRILVVTVKSMMTQFQKEMWNRFTIPLVRLDSSRIQSVRAKLPTNYNPFFYYDKTIISVDTLKNDLDYRTHLEHAWWDIIVIDEAHNVAKRGDRSSQRSKLASLLANRSDTLIMLTATPHDGKGQSVASLMNMLDPTAIADEENYTKDDIEGLLIRRFKKDIQDQVSGAFKERVITIERCAASAREEAAYDIFADMKLQMDESRTRGKGILFKTSLEKSLFSSPAACIKSIDARIRKLEKKYPDGDMPDIVTLKELKAALELISPADFSRYTKLLKLLNSTEYGWSPSKNNDRLVIFTERIETMRYLAENLKKDLGLKDNQLEVMHGGMSDKELQRIVDEFGRAESPIRVIVASDVASEGINLHYLSHRLIHFDIPWSLMVFQQRNGRVDRYGQTEQPDIFNWIEDKAGVFYKRSEVPVLGSINCIGAEETLFIVAGLIPNRKSTTVVDEWFGVLYKNDQFDSILSMSEVLQKTHLNVKVPNTQNVSEEQIARGQKLLGDVVDRAKKIMADKCAEYKEKTEPYIYEEMERLEQLEQRHKDAQLTLFDLGIPGMERKKSEKEREIEAIFTNFMDWERDTLEIEENPYIRIIAVVTGVR